MRAAAIEAAPPASEGTHVSTATSPVHLTASTVWPLRLAGLAALVNGAGFGAFDIPGTWHLAHDHEIWHADGNPTYGNGPFEAHGISVTVPVLLALFGTCLVLAIGGALLLRAYERSRRHPRRHGHVCAVLVGLRPAVRVVQRSQHSGPPRDGLGRLDVHSGWPCFASLAGSW